MNSRDIDIMIGQAYNLAHAEFLKEEAHPSVDKISSRAAIIFGSIVNTKSGIARKLAQVTKESTNDSA